MKSNVGAFMRGLGISRRVAIVGFAFAVACGGSTSEPVDGGNNGGTTVLPPNHANLLLNISGSGQTALVGSKLAPLVIDLVRTDGVAITNSPITFAVTSGSATLSVTSATTDVNGQAQTVVTLGSAPGIVQVTATATALNLSTTFIVAAGSGTQTTACSSGSPQSLAAGGVLTDITANGICLNASSDTADYALVAFNSNPDSEPTFTTFNVKASNAVALTSASLVPSASASLAPTSIAAPMKAALMDPQLAHDRYLRRVATQQLAPRIPALRQAYRQRAAAFSMIPKTLTVGQTITLNANGDDPCTNPTNVRARVAAISNTAIIVADSLNPAGGFTDAEYASFATTFDTLVNPLDVGAFGQPSDIDGNGKIVILFTKEVNKETPRGSGGFVAGYFTERDLFPVTSTSQLDGCATSNQGEMFYLLVPDPNGVYADPRTKSDVLTYTIGTLAHEYQHLINAGRRIYVNNADEFESVWLNEGLSHIAEELLYYRVSGLAPRSNITTSLISRNTAAFNDYQADNFGRYEVFLGMPTQTNVYADNDSLETRGATWNLLRYLADHRGSSDADTWQQLVNSNVAGQANLAKVFGATWMTSIRDWATSVFADDVTGVSDARFLQPSWNMRQIFPQLCADASCSGTRLGRFPLSTIPLSTSTPANVSVVAGGEAYLRFRVLPGQQTSIDWNGGSLPVNPQIRFTVVRTR